MLRFLAELPVLIIAWLSDALEIALRFLGRIFRFGDQEESEQSTGFSGRIRRAIGQSFWFLARLITYPFAGFFFRGRRFWMFLGSIPFFVAWLGVFGLSLAVVLNHERILNRYLSRAQNAYTKQLGALGARYALRWIDDQDYANADRKFLYSLVEIQAGQNDAGERVLEQLSPEDSAGLGIAHFWRAGKCAAELDAESIDGPARQEALKRFRWHLSHASGVRPAQIAVLEAMDAYWDGKPEQAQSKYREVWQADPLQSVGYASLLKRLGNQQESVQVLQEGAQRVASVLRTDPWNRTIRYQLASILEAKEDWGRAEQIFMEGFQIHRDAEASVAYRNFLDRRTSAGLKDPNAFREQAYCLVRLLRTQGATPSTLDVASRTFLRSDLEVAGLQRELNQWLVEGLDLPIVHLCLAVCKVIVNEVDSGVWHVEQATRYDSSMQNLVVPICDHLILRAAENRPLQKRLDDWKLALEQKPQKQIVP